jgi:signal transduction histidine kinase
MSDAVVGSKDLLTDAESLQQSIDQAAAEPSNVRMPAPRRAHSMGPYYALLAAAIVAPAILFGIVAWQTRVYMLSNATTEVTRTVELAARQAYDLLQIDQLLAERVNEYTRGMTWDEIQHSEALHLYLKRLAAEYPQAGVLFMIDGSGTARASNLVFPQPPITAADRDYFRALRGGNASVALGAMSQGRTGGQLNFNLAIRRTGLTDVFDGAILASTRQSFFTDFWQALVPTSGAVFGLYGDDGKILARLPPVDLADSTLTPASRIMQEASHAASGTFKSTSQIDNVDRFLAFQHIGDFNLFVAHGISRASVLDDWHRQVLIMAAFFGVAVVALSALAYLALRRARQEQYAVAEWERTARSLHAEEARTLGLNNDLRQRARDLEASNAELETFSYSVSHDLRTPLRAIDGYSAILIQDYTEKLDAEGRRRLSVVRQATAKMSRLIDDILDFSRTGRLPMNVTAVDMTAQVQGLIEEAQTHATDRQLRFEIGDLPTVRADASMIRRVWFNLIDNAIKFTATKPHAVITIGATQAEDEIVYSVVDNGIGFDRQYLGMLFGVGHRLVGVEFEGCGVGLAIVKRIVARHNGRVWADGRPNEGATFYFALPTQRAAD